MAREIASNVRVPFESATRGSYTQSPDSATIAPMVNARTGALPRVATARRYERPTLGDYIADVGIALGFDFHDWQRLLSDVSMELIPRPEPTDYQSRLRLNHQYVGALVGRQSGKTAWSVARVVAQAQLPHNEAIAERIGIPRFKSQHIAYTAQTRTIAEQKWREHIDIIESSAMARTLKHVHFANGKECAYFANGSTYRPVTPNRTGARGLVLDLVIVDEALAHPLWLLSALRPTMAQRDGAEFCLGAQFVVISNAGDDDSELLNRLQDLGRESANDPNARRCWLEWSMKPESDPLSEETWYETIPTLEQINGINIDFLRMEAETMPLEQFMREYLCVRSSTTADALFTSERWNEMYRTDVIIPYDVILALDVASDRQRASLVAVGSIDSYLPIEIVDSRDGLAWILERVTEVALRSNAPVVIDAGGPAASLIPALEFSKVTVIPIAAREVTNAAAMFFDAFQVKRLTHMNDYRLNDAVIAASKRAVGERWAFDRRGHVDISPLIAASFGVWAIETGQLNKGTIY